MTTTKVKVTASDHATVNTTTGEVTEIKTPTIYTNLTAHLRPKTYERNMAPSQTIPGQTMTVLEMVQRYRKGLPVSGAVEPFFKEGDDPIEDLSKMDLIDRQKYTDSVADALVEIKARIAATAKTKAEREILDKIDLAVKEELKKIRDRNQVSDIEESK